MKTELKQLNEKFLIVGQKVLPTVGGWVSADPRKAVSYFNFGGLYLVDAFFKLTD